MTGPLRNCGKADCRLCNRGTPDQPIDEEPLAALLVGIAAIVVLGIVFFVILPGAFG